MISWKFLSAISKLHIMRAYMLTGTMHALAALHNNTSDRPVLCARPIKKAKKAGLRKSFLELDCWRWKPFTSGVKGFHYDIKPSQPSFQLAPLCERACVCVAAHKAARGPPNFITHKRGVRARNHPTVYIKIIIIKRGWNIGLAAQLSLCSMLYLGPWSVGRSLP